MKKHLFSILLFSLISLTVIFYLIVYYLYKVRYFQYAVTSADILDVNAERVFLFHSIGTIIPILMIAVFIYILIKNSKKNNVRIFGVENGGTLIVLGILIAIVVLDIVHSTLFRGEKTLHFAALQYVHQYAVYIWVRTISYTVIYSIALIDNFFLLREPKTHKRTIKEISEQ